MSLICLLYSRHLVISCVQVRESWNLAKKEEVGEIIIVTLVRQKPVFAALYGVSSPDLLHSMTDEELASDKNLQAQAKRVQHLDLRHATNVDAAVAASLAAGDGQGPRVDEDAVVLEPVMSSGEV